MLTAAPAAGLSLEVHAANLVAQDAPEAEARPSLVAQAVQLGLIFPRPPRLVGALAPAGGADRLAYLAPVDESTALRSLAA